MVQSGSCGSVSAGWCYDMADAILNTHFSLIVGGKFLDEVSNDHVLVSMTLRSVIVIRQMSASEANSLVRETRTSLLTKICPLFYTKQF